MTFTEEFSKMRKATDVVRDALQTELTALLEQCTEPQRALFVKVYPEAREKMTEDSLRLAVDLCQRTVAKNRAGRQ